MTDDNTGTLISNAIGEIGRYQILVTLLLCLCRITEVEYQVLVLIVSPPPGNFTCSNSSMSKCDEACPGHQFDHSVWENTIIHEWDLVCGKKYVPSVIQCLVMFGVLCGNLVFGFLADRFGRFPPLIICIVLQIISGILNAFTPWLWLYILLRFLTTFSIGGTVITIVAIIVEMIGSKYRGLVTVLLSIPCSIGHLILSPIGYFSRRWDHIQLMISVPTITFMSYTLIHESPRWLLIAGRKERGIKTLEAIANCNKLPTDHIRSQVEQLLNQNPTNLQQKTGNLADLFRTRRMRTKTIILCCNWMIISMSYFGITQFIGQIGGDVFWNIGISGFILIPGIFLASYLINKLGRRDCLILFYIICVVSMFIISFLPEEPAWLIQVLAFLGVSSINNNFAVIYPYSCELYPTIVRAVGLGISSMGARVGGMVSPFILDLKQFDTWLPSLVFGILQVIGVVITLTFLPETRGAPFPDTVEEADQI